MNPSTDGHRKRLRDRWNSAGPKAFSDRDLLELLLTYTIPRVDTKPMAIDLLNRFGDLQSIFRQPRESLCQIKGIGPKTAELLNIIDATQKRQSKKPHGIIVSGPNDVENFLIQELGAEPEERFMIILLDQKNKIIELMDMEHGIENRAHVYIKKIVRASLDRNATAVICVHNHPSGSLNFSPQDITLTKAIHHALQPIEIRLLDHFLVTQGDVVSMKAEGISF